jgi:outer membrane protein TolC
MRVCTYTILFLLIVCVLPVLGQANVSQTSVDNAGFAIDSADLADLKLPPLATLLEAAENNPQIALLKSQRSVLDMESKDLKKDWLNQISLSGNYSYGVGTSMSSSASATAGSSTVLNYSNTLGSTYGIGLGVGTSIGYVLGYKNRIKKQSELIKQSDLNLQLSLQTIKLQIVNLYTEAGSLLTSQKKNIELLYLANTALKTKTADYAMGMTDLSGLIAAVTAQKSAQSDYDTSNAQLIRIFYQLEMLTGVKITNNTDE